jgi:hypothetical protein
MGQPAWNYGVVLVAAVTAGCSILSGNDKKQGALVVPFELGNQKDCASLNVVTVRAELDGGGVAKEVNCDAGKIRLDGVTPGSHDVVLYGLDKDDIKIMDSLAAGPLSAKVEDGKTTVIDPPAQLTLAPAKILLRWDFGFASCSSAAIETFRATAWRSNGSEQLLQTKVKCSSAGTGEGQYRNVADPGRDLSGDELGEVDVQPESSTPADVGAAVKFSFDPPGPGREIKLSLTCTEKGCEGSGQPD